MRVIKLKNLDIHRTKEELIEEYKGLTSYSINLASYFEEKLMKMGLSYSEIIGLRNKESKDSTVWYLKYRLENLNKKEALIKKEIKEVSLELKVLECEE